MGFPRDREYQLTFYMIGWHARLAAFSHVACYIFLCTKITRGKSGDVSAANGERTQMVLLWDMAGMESTVDNKNIVHKD